VTNGSYLETRLAVGTQQVVTVTVDDGHGNTASATLLVDVVGTPFVGTTATPVDSELNGLIGNYAPVTITATAISAGPVNAYLRTRLDQNPPIPSNLQAGSPPIYFDVSTDATLMQPPIQVCVDTTGMSFADAAHIRLYQYQHFGQLAAWTDITSAGYPQGHQICGQTNTLETFAIFYPQVPPTAVRTIAGNGILVNSNDGPGNSPIDDYVDGPATSTPLNYLYGGAYDRAHNRLFISDSGGYILQLNLNNNTITHVAGNGVMLPGILDGPGGDSRDDLVEAGNAFTTYVGGPAEMAITPSGDVVFFDRNTCRIRRLDLAQARVFAVAGNGTCGFSGDGFSAGLAAISYGQMAYDAAGNLFLGDRGSARVRRIDAVTNIISTVVGDGTFGTVVNGAPAVTGIGQPLGLAFDAQGQLLVTNGMDLLRVSTGADGLINGDPGETISLIGGCHTDCGLPFNGDGLAVSNPHVYLPGLGQLTVAQDGAVLLVDGPRIRRIAPGADGIVTGASDEIITTVGGYFDWATLSQISNFNGDTFSTQSLFGGFMVVAEDNQDRILVVDGNNFRVRRFGLASAPANPNSADLAISVSGSPDPVDTGADLRYLITVSNNGPATATGVTVTYAIPAGAVFQSAQSRNGIPCNTPAVGSAGTVTCDFGSLASGASNNVPITIRWQTAGSLSSTFAVAGTEADPNSANNTTSVTTTVHLAPAVITVNEFIAVNDAVGVLPSAMIGVNENIVVTDTSTALPSAMIGVSENIVVADSAATTPVPPDLLIIKRLFFGVISQSLPRPAVPQRVANGDPVNFVMVITNAGTIPFTGTMRVTDTLPAGLTLTFVGSICSQSAQVYTCDLDFSDTPLPPGWFTWVIVRAQVGNVATPGQPVTLRNIGSVSAPGEPNTQNNTDFIDFIVAADITPPVISACAAPATLWTNAAGLVALPDMTLSVVATDNSPGLLTFTQSPVAGTLLGVGTHAVTITASDSDGNTSTCQTSAIVQRPTLSLQLPANMTLLATNPAGKFVFYTATATEGPTTFTPTCTPDSQTMFPIGTTTVNCIAFGRLTPGAVTGSFTVTVNVGVPGFTTIVAGKGRDPDGSFWIELRLTNTGTGHSRDVDIASLGFKTLNGSGVVTYDAVRSGPMPLRVGSIDVGETRPIRLYLDVPKTVTRFSITEGLTFLNTLATRLSFSAGQAVIP
jgi:uncharacterized repeat protein (TIGR01451 family)